MGDHMETEARSRSAAWWLLSSLYLEPPTAGFLKELRGHLQQTVFAEDDPALEALMMLKSRLLEAGSDPEGLALELNREYVRLFRGIREGYGPPPPYESLYRGGQFNGEHAQAVMAEMREAGLGVIEPSVGPQDHLGTELRYMAMLAHMEAEARRMGDRTGAEQALDRQDRFLQRMTSWVPAYCERLASETEEPFYLGLSMLTRHALTAFASTALPHSTESV